jgi:hypothetical protein
MSIASGNERLTRPYDGSVPWVVQWSLIKGVLGVGDGSARSSVSCILISATACCKWEQEPSAAVAPLIEEAVDALEKRVGPRLDELLWGSCRLDVDYMRCTSEKQYDKVMSSVGCGVRDQSTFCICDTRGMCTVCEERSANKGLFVNAAQLLRVRGCDTA